MLRYFFDVHDGIDVIDDVGQDFPDIEAAKDEALRIAGRFASNLRLIDEDGGALIVVVRDAPDAEVLSVRLVFSIETRRGFQRRRA